MADDATPGPVSPGARPTSTNPGATPSASDLGARPTSTNPGATPNASDLGALPNATGLGARPSSANRRLLGSFTLGLAAGAATGAGSGGDVSLGILTALLVMHSVFVAWGWRSLWPLDAAATSINALREDFRPALEEAVVVVAAVGGLACIGLLMVAGHSRSGQWAAALALGAVFMAWGSLNLMYAARYARIYYQDGASGSGSGIDFNQTPPPAYRDFLYFSYNLGMTYQVSDTSVTSTAIRSVVLRHCLLAWAFGLVVLAGTINAVSQVVTG